MTPSPTNTEDWLDNAKAVMEWTENREPTILEYLRYYRNGTIGSIHVEAAIKSHFIQELEEVLDAAMRTALSEGASFEKLSLTYEKSIQALIERLR